MSRIESKPLNVEICNQLDSDVIVSVVKSETSNTIYVTLKIYHEETGVVKSGDYGVFQVPEYKIT